MPAVAGRMDGADMSLRSKKCRKRPMPLPAERNYDFGGSILPPISLGDILPGDGIVVDGALPCTSVLAGGTVILARLGDAEALVLAGVGRDRRGRDRRGQPEREQTRNCGLDRGLLLHDGSYGIESFCKKTSNGIPATCAGVVLCAHLALWSCGQPLHYTPCARDLSFTRPGDIPCGARGQGNAPGAVYGLLRRQRVEERTPDAW